MFDLTFLQIVLRAAAGVVILTLFGGLLAAVARVLGDRGPQYDGRLTLNPFSHVDIFGLVAATFALVGWIRPVALDPSQLRFGRLGPILCALLALAGILVFGQLVLLLMPLIASYWPPSSSGVALAWVTLVSQMSAWFVAFNLLPFPPLAGGYVLAAIAPSLHAQMVARIVWISVALAVVAVLARGVLIRPVFGPVASWLSLR